MACNFTKTNTPPHTYFTFCNEGNCHKLQNILHVIHFKSELVNIFSQRIDIRIFKCNVTFLLLNDAIEALASYSFDQL